MKHRWLYLLLLLVFVGCKYDDGSLDRYIKKGAKSIEAQKAVEILSKDRGFWSVNGSKSYVKVLNEDGTSEMVPFSEINLYGNSTSTIYQFESNGDVTAYHYTSFPERKWSIYDVDIDWDKKVIEFGPYYDFFLNGVTENYLIVEENTDGNVNAKFIFVYVYTRMLDADVTRFLNQTEFVDERE